MLAQTLGDNALRAALLRFVDVFPALNGADEIALHLSDYLGEARVRGKASGWLSGAAAAARHADGSRLAGWVASLGARAAVRRMANRFIVKHDNKSLTGYIQALEAKGYLFTLDVLGEAVHGEHEAEAFFQRYLDLTSHLGRRLGRRRSPAPPGSGPRVNLSIKLSSLTSHFDPWDPEGSTAVIQKRLRPLFRAAREAGSFIHIDMETRSEQDLTLKVFCDTLEEPEFRDWPDVGIVLQAYLRTAEASLAEVLDWVERRGTEITVRLVKGAYWDSEQIWARQKGWPIPVYLDKAETDLQFERCLERLLAVSNRVRTAVGSHNARSLARAFALSERLGVAPGRMEIQMLHGMAEPLRRAVRDEGWPVRIYVPTGDLVPGMAYLVRRLLENTSQNSFVRQMSVEQAAVQALLANPAELLARRKGGSR